MSVVQVVKEFLMNLDQTTVLYCLASVPLFFILRYMYEFLFTPFFFTIPEQKYNRKGRPNRIVGKVPPFYPNGWFKVCDSFELAKGEHKYIHQLGQHIIVFRGAIDGKVGVVDAYWFVECFV